MVVGNAVAGLPRSTASAYAPGKAWRSRRSGNEVSRICPGSERTGCCEKKSTSVRPRPATRWNE